MTAFEQLNKHIVFTTVDTRKEASHLLARSQKDVKEGQSIVIFFDNRYLLTIAPGQDPYKTRSDIDAWLATQKTKSNVAVTDTSTASSTGKKKSSKS